MRYNDESQIVFLKYNISCFQNKNTFNISIKIKKKEYFIKNANRSVFF